MDCTIDETVNWGIAIGQLQGVEQLGMRAPKAIPDVAKILGIESWTRDKKTRKPDVETEWYGKDIIDGTRIFRLPDGSIATLPYQLYSLATCIEDSKYLSELGDNWDGEGAKEVLPATWAKAVRILCSIASKLYSGSQITLQTPHIDYYGEGGISLLWSNFDLKLLILVPEQERPQYSVLPEHPSFNGYFEEPEYSRSLIAYLQSHL